MHTGENPSLGVCKSWIVEEDLWPLWVRFAIFDLRFSDFAWSSWFGFRKGIRASADDEIKSTNNPSLNSDSNHGKTVHGSLGCDHLK